MVLKNNGQITPLPEKYYLILLTLITFTFLSCQRNNMEIQSDIGPMDWVTTLDIDDGTQGMVQTLDTIRQFYKTNELNLLTMRFFDKKNDHHKKNRIMPGLLELYYGQTERAIDIFKKMQQKNQKASPDQQKRLLHLLAIAHLRLGEQENCISNHSPESCIIPIQEHGQHQLKKGASEAIECYTQISEKYPDDITAKYLLNFAYMLLGEHPDNVPESYRLKLTPQKEKNNNIKPFKNIATKLGIDITSLSGGAIMEDFNNDGFLDIIVSGWSLDDQIRLFNNDGKGNFNDYTETAGLTGLTGGLNMICADFNNDGYRDVFVLRGAWRRAFGRFPNSLLQNNGDGTFSDVTKAAGVLSFSPTQTATFADFNNDGWLDLFVGNESRKGEASVFPCEFFINNKDGTFSNKAKKYDMEINAFVKGVTSGDYDNDGWPDLYVSCLRDKNYLFKNNGINNNGKLSFKEISLSAGVSQPEDSFPTWFWDYNNDGFLDLYVAGYALRQGRMPEDVSKYYAGETVSISNPVIYQNNGDGTFSDYTKASGMQIPIHTMGANFGDINNDGFPDVYLGTGEPDFRSIIPNRMFLNVDGQKFEDVTTEAGVGHVQKGHGIAFGDLDNDGDQDILAELGGAAAGDFFQNALFENPGYDNNWIHILLEGKTSNRDGIGARIQIIVETDKGEKTIYKVVSAGGSFGSNSLQQEIGLGKVKQIKRLEIYWPTSKKKHQFNNIAVNQRIKVKENTNEIIPFPMEKVYFKTTIKKHCH